MKARHIIRHADGTYYKADGTWTADYNSAHVYTGGRKIDGLTPLEWDIQYLRTGQGPDGAQPVEAVRI